MVHLQVLLTKLEPVLLLIAAVAFLRSGSARRFPALATYFAVRGAFVLGLDAVLWNNQVPVYGSPRYIAYFWGFWLQYLVCAIVIFFVVQEIFKRVMEPVPGLRRLGLLTFRWIAIVSAVVSVGAIAMPASTRDAGSYLLCEIGLHVMRCVSIMELCLMAFLALTIHTLGRSFRSRLFGVGLGFGLQAASDLIGSAMLTKFPAMDSPVNGAMQVMTSVVLIAWAVYFMVPEPSAERRMIVLPPSSVMARWNALAKGIGQAPEAAVAAQPSGFFLQDIEGVVDRVLAKNPIVVGR
ncbi:MAG TPA: hypothetical protein VHX60_18475 [Acidobacteriaceae bacterium]|jgi:hypothetical protein|nr:hypothetical protein [Acidobacteriaceae bacterium]